ncbi:MAG: D-alanyl-D-alanine carboxypeptidase family protein [Candidatus Zambryskibacteria bacterium]|nr:D-alanyl-D-alanine carboxypeptidase family protein [Candidatus Zambryskibacteria bacterium]
MTKHSSHGSHSLFPLAYGWITVLVIALGLLGYGTYQYKTLNTLLKNTQDELASTTVTLRGNIKTLEENLSLAQTQNTDLQKGLQNEQIKNNSYAQQIEIISSTVGELYKLSQTDKELLQKYSSVYFLNENYIPSSLADIDTNYLQRKEKVEKIHTAVKPYLEAMVRSANEASIPLTVLSAYRSFNTQVSLKTGYKVQYGSTAANKFSADQGYSEHQLGSTVDFTTPSNGESLGKFEKTPSYIWLLENAHRYGFILSYPKGNTFYQFEPWHWRFVGVELATRLHVENKNFYDFDQRTINKYLSKIFN